VAGECDIAESCTGTSSACPTDTFNGERDGVHDRQQRVHVRHV